MFNNKIITKMSNALEIIQAIMLEKFDLSAERVIPSARLDEDLMLGSLEQIELCFLVDEVCGITTADEDWICIKTVGDLVNFIEAKVN